METLRPSDGKFDATALGTDCAATALTFPVMPAAVSACKITLSLNKNEYFLAVTLDKGATGQAYYTYDSKLQTSAPDNGTALPVAPTGF